MAYTLNRVGGSAGEFASIYVSGITQSGNTVTALTPSGLTKTAAWETHQTINPEWKGLPSGYTQVEYIQSSGTQYIDTGITIGQNITNLHAKYYRTTSSKGQILFGAYDGTNSYYYDYSENDDTTQTCYVFGTKITSSIGLFIGDYETDLSINGTTATYTVNNTSVSATVSTTPTSSYHYTLFADNSNGSMIYYTSCRLKSFSISVSGNLVRNFIPCINSSNVVGLYDIVNNQFYANSGSGTFTAGNEIPKYITSTGWFLNNLDEYGLYTVTASTTGKSVSDTILIDFATVFTLQLAYLELYLYDEGEEFTSTTGGWTLYKDQYATGSQKNATNVRLYWSGSSNIGSSNVYTTNAIDVTKYSTLHVRWVCDSIYRSSSNYGWGMSDKISGNDLFSLRTTLAETTTTVDISSYTTLQPSVSQYGASVYLYEMWLD